MIRVETSIVVDAPIETIFDLARDIDVHTRTVWKHTKERAVAGRTSGKIERGETVTFQATHLGVRQKLTSEIVEFDRPRRFVDRMVRGAFKSMRHEHDFVQIGGGAQTLMKDTLTFSAPLGPLGRLVERIILRRYMTRFLEDRNRALKKLAEGMAAKGSVQR
ncbi:SRPBCC family protein [Paenibacillus antri]|uniref:SRPBCC family protein n=1 Tax=Paenibacillus antri TaxID=2582848 RepID=A0A5R9GGN5_9BACL|nr:SRPBCC family protein [Paenibacillus antri]TLS52548.1 SRPBCC family protein [Paenibacillus antri]